MKKWIQTGFILMLCLWMVNVASASETATKEECVSKVKSAAALVKDQGQQAALAKFNDPNSEFTWKDSYVFVLDGETAEVLAHTNPKLVGKVLTGMKDSNGKMFFLEMINVAKEKGEGWVNYTWPKPGETTPTPKTTFVLKVPDTNLVLGAGTYE